MEDQFNEGEIYTIQYDNVINDKKLMASTRLLASEIRTNGYKIVGEYLQELSESDLVYLLDISSKTESEEFSEIALLSEMLATAEGLDPSADIEIFHQRIVAMIGFLACEGLFRKGMVKLYRENMSFGADMGDKLLVEKIRD